eukprot:CAMPEP_0198434430 /NCGR_PEP_ID=MMETSP1452-20131203/32638_1 /TAXON_ID=1181717 /ORGANISM="Synchroma pusillum, Strain CCMP3072" /LENGTH=117 /DNA_ID=CAMNT_0044154941 /DNA_START=55 /DNA_END=405 /DNA_ORIENTATION=-
MTYAAVLPSLAEDVAFQLPWRDGLKTITACGTLMCLVGKLALGSATDALGGEMMLRATLLTLAVCMALLALSPTVVAFFPVWMVVALAYSGAWGASASIIRNRFPRSEWDRELANVA